MAFFTVLQLRNDPLRFTFGAPLSVQPGAKASHNTDKILDHIFFAVLSQVDDFDLAFTPDPISFTTAATW
jgi:hypothetical protein